MVKQQSDKPGLARKLNLPLMLEEGRSPQMFSSLLLLGSLFIGAIVIWASITQIRELAIAPGQIKPVGSTQLVQHFEGGMVRELLVKEGQVVDLDTPLVRLRPTAATSDLDQLQVRAAVLSLKKVRLEAAMKSVEPDFGALAVNYPILAAEQKAILTKTREQAIEERAVLFSRIDQRSADIDSFTKQVASLDRQVKILDQQVKIRRSLLKKGLGSRVSYLESQRVYEKTRGEYQAMNGQLKKALKAINEVRSALSGFDADIQKKLANERAQVSSELAELKKTIAKHEDRVSRLLVRAPIRGVVQELVPKAVGEVIKPGDLIAKIVPLDQELIAEVQIAPDDIGHVKVGDKVEIKISTFDPARYGRVKGKLKKLSATTFKTDRGEYYYKGIISIENKFVGAAKQNNLIMPGMVVSAEIVTGAKSLIRYLLKPVYRSLDVAFSER